MKILILKLGATGDVVRTTTLLRRLEGAVTWITTAGNRAILPQSSDGRSSLRVIAWDDRSVIQDESFDLAISLEDDVTTAEWLSSIRIGRIFGAFVSGQGRMADT